MSHEDHGSSKVKISCFLWKNIYWKWTSSRRLHVVLLDRSLRKKKRRNALKIKHRKARWKAENGNDIVIMRAIRTSFISAEKNLINQGVCVGGNYFSFTGAHKIPQDWSQTTRTEWVGRVIIRNCLASITHKLASSPLERNEKLTAQEWDLTLARKVKFLKEFQIFFHLLPN